MKSLNGWSKPETPVSAPTVNSGGKMSSYDWYISDTISIMNFNVKGRLK